MKMLRSVIVPQPHPFPKNIVASCPRKLMYGRPSPEPFPVIEYPHAHLGLLEHDLREENGIWILRFSPGKVPFMHFVEGKYLVLKNGYSLKGGGSGFQGPLIGPAHSRPNSPRRSSSPPLRYGAHNP